MRRIFVVAQVVLVASAIAFGLTGCGSTALIDWHAVGYEVGAESSCQLEDVTGDEELDTMILELSTGFAEGHLHGCDDHDHDGDC